MTSSWTSKMWERANGLPLFTATTTPATTTVQEKSRHRHSNRQKPTAQLLHVSVILVCLASSIIPPCQGFFFPKSFFRKGNENQPPPPPPSVQQHPRVLAGGQVQHNAYGGGDHLQGSGTNVQPATRIVNRPPYNQPPRNNDQVQQPSGPVPGSGFHVPRELCMACESFPWMPVAGERPPVGAASSSVSHSQQPQEQPRQPFLSGQGSAPTKTIVINALGEAQGPVPVPPQLPSRRPFAIQFDANQSGNKVNYQDAPKQPPPPPPQAPVNRPQNPPPQQKPERPVSFQIFEAQTGNQQQHQQPTILQQQHQHHPIGLQPPPIPQAFGPPTVLIPVNTQSAQVGANLNVQGNQGSVPPPNPLQVGTIIATQQNKVPVPQFQKIEPAKLVYQEHFTAQASSSSSSPQNFKVPIIPHPKPGSDIQTQPENLSSNNIVPPHFAPQPNYGPPPQRPGHGGIFLQMRPPAPYQHQPPRPSLNMKPPVPVIHYGKPIRIPNNVGPQRPSGQVIFPPPQAFLQMGPPPPIQGQTSNAVYGAPRPDASNSLESSVRPQDERRPSPSGQVLNVQSPQPTQTNRPPIHTHQAQILNSNSIQPVPIPIPTTLHNNQQESGTNGNNNNNIRPNKIESTFTQESGWEIIPSIQTDLTHLFSSEKGKPQGAKELPVPVPIPVPQSHPPKSPFFIVAGAGQQQQHQEQIKVQDVTYHEESRNPVPSVSVPLNTISEGGQQQSNEQKHQQQQQQQHSSLHSNSLAQNENQQNVEQERRPQIHSIPQQLIRTRPFILGLPAGPTRPVIFRTHPHQTQPFQQLHPSIMTALNHAQQTSLLTHQYFRQPNVGQTIRENTIYVSPVVNTATANAQQVQQLQQQQQPTNAALSESASNSVQQESHEGNNLEEQNQQQKNYGIDPRIPMAQGSADHTNPNCQHNQQQQQSRQPWLIPITTHQKEQHQAELNSNLQQQENQEAEQVSTTSVDQSISSSDGFPHGQDDQSKSHGNSGRDNNNVSENDVSPTLDTLSPEPTYSTSLASVPPTVATSGVSTSPGIRGSISVQDNGNKGSYLIYYPRPVSKSPVYWVQPSRTVSQGVVRLSPQISPVSPSVASTVVTWSRPRVVVANQFRAQQQPQLQEQQHQGRYEDPANSEEARQQASYEPTDGSEEQTQSAQVSAEHQQQHEDDDENIPFGQKLGVTRDSSNRIQKPYDIISVGGSDDEAQSLEETSVSSDHSQGLESGEQGGKEQFGDSEYSPSGQDGGSTGVGNDNVDVNSGGPTREYPEEGQDQQNLQNENSLQSVQQQETKSSNQDEHEDADDERDDFGYRPQTQTIFRKPISTTVIHSPGASSFQSLKLPNFKPHRVIVHDFTTHSANAAATGPSAAASENQESVESSGKGQAFSSETTSGAWVASQKLKSPKLVENSDDEEESSESIHRPQGFNIQEVIGSGPVSTADCLTTAHSGHLLTSYSSTSPRTAESLGTAATSAKGGRDIFLPLGSRFPAGRPSIFSTLRRPISLPVSVPTTTTTTTTTTTIAPSSTSESTQGNFSPSTIKRERYLGQSPSGFAASIAVPVYRRPISISHTASRDPLGLEETRIGSGNTNNIHGTSDSITTYVRPQANGILTTEDIYKTSEEKVVDGASNNEPIKVVESSTSSVSTSSADSDSTDSLDEIMSTEKSSSFSVSVVDEKSGGFSNNRDERGFSASLSFGNNDISQQVGSKPHAKVNVVQVTSVPVISDAEPIATTIAPSSSSANGLTSTTAAPAPASTSTKIVKTVRVRQRMRSGSLNGPLRTRFHGGGRVRVVHRPANQEYIRHFPEFATQDGDKLAKEEEQEVKNALIELKKSTEPVKTH